MQKTFVIGIAGQIASGKSARCKHLLQLAHTRSRGYSKFFEPHIINADTVAHELYAPGQPGYVKVIDKFGEGILSAPLTIPLEQLRALKNPEKDIDDEALDALPLIDRKALGKIVFKDPAQLHALNTIVWPLMDEKLLNIVEEKTNASSLKGVQHAMIILEAAVMIESGFFKHCDDVWLFACDDSVAVDRMMHRDGLTAELAKDRIRAQKTIDERLAYLTRSGFAGGKKVFDTTKYSDLEKGLVAVTEAFDEWWELRMRPLLSRKSNGD